MDLSIKTVSAANGVKIPQLGFGVYKLKKEKEFNRAVREAIRVGYRHFDTARIYGNEEALGAVIQESDISREQFFITSKVWNTDHGYDTAKKAFETSCRKLKVEYLDMYLIHFAAPDYLETWKAIEDLYMEGRIKVIGVANFEIEHLGKLAKQARVLPMVNQIETHPKFSQDKLHHYLKNHDILHEAWGPLGQGDKTLLEHPALKRIAQGHHKTAAQVILRWHLQREIIIIPKSSNPKRIQENSEIFDFFLTDEEMTKINQLNTGKRSSINPTGYMISPLYNRLMRIFMKILPDDMI